MAERGVDRSDDNPFSFKSFINGKDKVSSSVENDIFSDDDDEEDIFATKPSPASSASSRKQQQQTDNLDFDLSASPPEDKPKDNPFSFKKFLSSSGSASTTTTKPKTSKSSSYAPPDIASDIPAFTNNYFDAVPNISASSTSSTSSKKHTGSSSNDVNSSAAASKVDLTANRKKETSSASRNKSNENLKKPPNELRSEGDRPNHRLQLPLFGNEDGDDDDDFDFEDKKTHAESANGIASPAGLQLPDFLSDGPLLGGKPTMPVHQRDRDGKEDDLMGQIHALQEENRRLRDDLSRMKQKYDDKNERITQLKKDLERQKKKEAEETAVMEKAVLQVEENLVTTTKRAVQAESVVSKLKQEVKGLQNQIRCLTAENEACQSGDGGMSDIRERTKYTSEQLKIGAEAAERSLKDLLQGVDKMKLLSQVLASWEKITEVKSETDDNSAS